MGQDFYITNHGHQYGEENKYAKCQDNQYTYWRGDKSDLSFDLIAWANEIGEESPDGPIVKGQNELRKLSNVLDRHHYGKEITSMDDWEIERYLHLRYMIDIADSRNEGIVFSY